MGRRKGSRNASKLVPWRNIHCRFYPRCLATAALRDGPLDCRHCRMRADVSGEPLDDETRFGLLRLWHFIETGERFDIDGGETKA